MTFLAPAQLLWLLLLVPLVALYVLKRRRREKEVASTLLWEQALRDLRAERPWKRLAPSIPLLLQALAIVAGAIALAQPTGLGGMPPGGLVAVVVDVSASMAARHEGGRRIDAARERARALARSLPPRGRVMFVEAGAEPVVLLPPTRDRVAIDRALRRLRVRGGRADLEAAIALSAERVASLRSGSRVVVLTDEAADGAVSLRGLGAPVEVQRIGGRVANQGIVDADVRARATKADRCDVFVRVANHSEERGDVFLSVRAEGRDGILASRRLRIAPNARQSVVFDLSLGPDANARAPLLRIGLTPASGEEDALDLDDEVALPSPARRRLPVFLVGSAPASVLRVLRSDRDVDLYQTTLARLAQRDEDEPPLDGLWIYRGELPPEPPPGDSVVVAPSGDRAFELDVGAEVRGPRVVDWAEGDPRLRFVSFAELHLAHLRPLGRAGSPLLVTDAGPAIVAVSRPSGETTVLGFDPSSSDWPRQAGFVVFFRNLLERARARRAAGGVPEGPLGEPLRVPAPDGSRVRVVAPGGSVHEAESRGGVALVEVPAEPGVYRAAFRTGAGERELYAVRSLLDDAESDLRPRLRFVRAEGEAGAPLATAPAARESWVWAAVLFLGLLLAETFWATRRAA